MGIEISLAHAALIGLAGIFIGMVVTIAIFLSSEKTSKVKSLASRQILTQEADLNNREVRLKDWETRLDRRDLDMYLRERKLDRREEELNSLRAGIERAYAINQNTLKGE